MKIKLNDIKICTLILLFNIVGMLLIYMYKYFINSLPLALVLCMTRTEV